MSENKEVDFVGNINYEGMGSKSRVTNSVTFDSFRIS
jgi:hypothetical protein